MDNAEKINNKHKVKDLFLKEASYIKDGKKDTYNLEEEFNKTKKNKNIIYTFGFIFVVLFVVCSSVGIGEYSRRKNQKQEIKINEFKDLLLEEILNAANKYENRLVIVKNELGDILDERELEIEDVKYNTKSKRSKISGKNISDTEKNKLIKEINLFEKKKIKEIEKKYQVSIKEKEAEIKDIENQIKDLDKKKINEGLNNISKQERIEDLQMSKMIAFYEEKLGKNIERYNKRLNRMDNYYTDYLKSTNNKYNPKITEGELFDILEIPVNNIDLNKYKISDKKIYNELIDELESEGLIDKEGYQDIILKNIHRNIIADYLKTIPYENSVPLLLDRLDLYDRYLINQYRTMLYYITRDAKKGSEQLSESNELLDGYIYAVGKTIDKSGVDGKKYAGYILNPKKSSNIIFKLDTRKKIKNHQVGYIYDEKNQINTVVFLYTGNKLTLKLSEGENNNIRSFNRIMIE